MEQSGGGLDVIDFDSTTNEYIFCDGSPESLEIAAVSATTAPH